MLSHKILVRLFRHIGCQVGIADPPPLFRTTEPTIALYVPATRQAAYNPDLLLELLRSNPDASYGILVGLFAHELGHHLGILDFTGVRQGRRVSASEVSADMVSGFALRRVGASAFDREGYIQALAKINVYDEIHDLSVMRAQDIRAGYDLSL